MSQIGAAGDYYDISTIPSRAFALITKEIGHELSGYIWWEAISNLDKAKDIHLTFHGFAEKTLQAAQDMDAGEDAIRRGWQSVGLTV